MIISPSSYSDTKIIFINPVGEGVSQSITIQASGQVGSTTFDYDAPILNTAVPALLNTQGGQDLTLTGTNFGLNPTATLNNIPCIVKSFTPHTRVICSIPPGQGTGLTNPVQVIGASQFSNSLYYTFGLPVIGNVFPLGGITSGGSMLTITGYNFGFSGTVTIGGNTCPTATGFYNHTYIICQLPAGKQTLTKQAKINITYRLSLTVYACLQQNNNLFTDF